MSHTDTKNNNTESNRKEKNTEQLVMADMDLVGYLLLDLISSHYVL